MDSRGGTAWDQSRVDVRNQSIRPATFLFLPIEHHNIVENMSRIIYTYKYIYFVLVTFDTWYTTLASTSNLSNLPSIKSRNHGSEGDRHEEIEQGITGITSIGYRPLSLRRVAPLVHDPSLAAFSSSVHQSVHRRLGTLRSTPRARHSFVDRHTAAHESRWSPIVVDRTHERLIDPSSCFLLGPTQGSREKSSRWRARVETESGPRIRSRQRANSGEKNILGTRRQPVNQPDYAARGTRRITCRSRGNRQRIELSGRTIPFQISFTTIHLSYISTECPPAPSYNRYITRHVALKREKKRGRRSRGRRGKRESIDVVGSLHRFTSAQNTNNKLATPSFATFWHDDFVFGQRVTREMTGWRGGDGGRWQARPNITRRWWR